MKKQALRQKAIKNLQKLEDVKKQDNVIDVRIDMLIE
jgi:hypothetical protein